MQDTRYKQISPIDIFETLNQGSGSFLLESPNSTGRYSFIGINPIKTITDFEELRKTDLKHGAFGLLSYDFAWEIENLPNKAKDDLDIPKVMFVIPETLVVFDHFSNEMSVYGDKKADIVNRLRSPYRKAATVTKKNKKNVTDKRYGHRNPNPDSNLNKSDFLKIVRQAKDYISAGDIYQANLSQRFEVPIKEPPWETYKKLRKINPSPFASYFDFGEFQLVSCSPERLIKLENGIAETRPIAGTRPISATQDELLLDPKERAEHIMLVDLERNDLGKVCEYGSVHVDESMVCEKYSHVIHIVSNVKGKLRSDKDKFDLIRAMFPGGTITGCPKIRSMEIIEELEPVKRGPYTGSVGYIMPNKMDLNIVIRTILVKNKTAYVQAGAGIVADSVPEKEYQETLHKAQAMFEALGDKRP